MLRPGDYERPLIPGAGTGESTDEQIDAFLGIQSSHEAHLPLSREVGVGGEPLSFSIDLIKIYSVGYGGDSPTRK
jgi:hypothetical protein